jgi:protein-tyrosine phosphatase
MGKRYLIEESLFRGGKVNHIAGISEIGGTRTIINLRKGPDPEFANVWNQHFPKSNNCEKYNTADKEVARWLTKIIQFIRSDECIPPILLHCTSGKDRTGVVVAAILKILNVPDDLIIEEYLLSDGEVKREWIQQSLDGIGDPSVYFRRIKNMPAIFTKFQV